MAVFDEDPIRTDGKAQSMKDVVEPVPAAERPGSVGVGVKRAMRRVGTFHGAWQERHRALVAICDRELRRLAGRARSACSLVGSPFAESLHGLAHSTTALRLPLKNEISRARGESSFSSHISPLTTVSLGEGLQQQLNLEIAELRRAADRSTDSHRRAELLHRASELASHLSVLLEATYQSAESPMHLGDSSLCH